jgi:16S rRNA (guanine966-N2)-methyltransferase
MRVISGSARGRKLKAPPGLSTRPMADKIREAAFSMLASLGVTPDRVLDLYSGSGSVGIEALSRGATSVDFVEQNRVACDVIRDNLRHIDFEAQARVNQTSVGTFLARVQQPYDFVIMDPPYADPDIVTTMSTLGSSAAVEDGTILLIGHSPRVELPETAGALHCLRRRCHGDSCFSIYEALIEHEAESDEETET